MFSATLPCLSHTEKFVCLNFKAQRNLIFNNTQNFKSQKLFLFNIFCKLSCWKIFTNLELTKFTCRGFHSLNAKLNIEHETSKRRFQSDFRGVQRLLKLIEIDH